MLTLKSPFCGLACCIALEPSALLRELKSCMPYHSASRKTPAQGLQPMMPLTDDHPSDNENAIVALARSTYPADQSPCQRWHPAGLGPAERQAPAFGAIVRWLEGWAQPRSSAMQHVGSGGSGWKRPASLPRTSVRFPATAALQINVCM